MNKKGRRGIGERKIIRTTIGPKKTEDNNYQAIMNHEINKALQRVDIVNIIKHRRVKWLGHICRAGKESLIYIVLQFEF